jgi:hypothetical protein
MNLVLSSVEESIHTVDISEDGVPGQPRVSGGGGERGRRIQAAAQLCGLDTSRTLALDGSHLPSNLGRWCSLKRHASLVSSDEGDVHAIAWARHQLCGLDQADSRSSAAPPRCSLSVATVSSS